MLNKITSLAFIMAAALTFSSCLGDDDDDDSQVDYYNDTAIGAFSLGRMYVIKDTVTAKGADSTYLSTVAGSQYKFVIDHAKAEIYNPDSLPYGTIPHALATVVTKNSGIVYLKAMDSDSLSYFVSSDSVNFSQPRQFRVVAQSGKVYRTYTVRVNVHKQKANNFAWCKTDSVPAFATMKGLKAVALDSLLFVFGSNGSQTIGYSARRPQASTFKSLSATFSADAYKSVVAAGSSIYLLDGTAVKRSSDGNTWQQVGTDARLKQLIAAKDNMLFALSADGKIISSADGGASWNADGMDADASFLPAENISFTSSTLSTNSDICRLTIAGTRTDNAHALLWTKLIDSDEPLSAYPWTFVDAGYDNYYPLSAYPSLQVMACGKMLVAFGLSATALSPMAYSPDGGITWKSNSIYVLPRATSGITTMTATADADNFIWIVCGGTGEVWRGRLSQLGWTAE